MLTWMIFIRLTSDRIVEIVFFIISKQEDEKGDPLDMCTREYAAHSFPGPLSFARHPLPQYSSSARNAHP